jgi:hypothetical protein
MAHFAVVLFVKNVDQTSLHIENDGQHLTIQLSSLGSGFYPLHHQLCLDFDESTLFETAENATTITFNDDNVLILFKKTSPNQPLTQFSSGVNREDMKVKTLFLSLKNKFVILIMSHRSIWAIISNSIKPRIFFSLF